MVGESTRSSLSVWIVLFYFGDVMSEGDEFIRQWEERQKLKAKSEMTMIEHKVKNKLDAYYWSWKHDAGTGDYLEATEWAGFICMGLMCGFEPKWTDKQRMEFMAWVELKLPGGIDGTLSALDYLLSPGMPVPNPNVQALGSWTPELP